MCVYVCSCYQEAITLHSLFMFVTKAEAALASIVNSMNSGIEASCDGWHRLSLL